MISLPKGQERTIKFDTDVENDYFDRSEDSGEFEISILQINKNDSSGGTEAGSVDSISEVLNIVKSSPNKGTIKLTLEPREELNVGDEIEIKASLTAPGEVFEEIIVVKITDKEAPKEKVPQEEEQEEQIGLPKLHKVKQENWDKLQENGIEMDYNTVMCPMAEGDQLQEIYINLDSKVFMNHRSKLKGEAQILTAEKKYISSVYFHTLFLYMITKRRKYSIFVEKESGEESVTIEEYIKDIFDNYYSDFLLNFGMEQLMEALED